MVKAALLRFARFFVLLYVGAVATMFAIQVLGWDKRLTTPETLPKLLVVLGLVAAFTFAPRRGKPASKWLMALWGLVFLSSVPFLQINYLFGVNDIESVLVFFGGNTVDKMQDFGAAGYLPDILGNLALYLVFLLATLGLYLRVRYFGLVLAGLLAVFVINHPVTLYLKQVWFPKDVQIRISSEVDRYGLRIRERPAERKNLVVFYLEGLEQNFLRAPEIKPYTAGLQTLADRGIAFRNVAQVNGTNYSVAGVTATQCGVPMLPGTTFNIRQARAQITDGIYKQITCLGDVLAQDGYDTSFFVGAGLDDFSLGNFLTDHGFSNLFGNGSESDAERNKYGTHGWGITDALVFQKAREELMAASGQEKPFLIVVETMATHGPDGFLDVDCLANSGQDNRMLAALECTSGHVERYVDLVSELGLDDNTVIAVMSDHLSWKTALTPVLESLPPRRNLFFLLNAGGPTVVDKPGVAFDIYPTILEAIGYSLEGDRANMGVSLFSDKPGMASQYGLEQLNDGLTGNRELARWLWRKAP